MIVVTYACCLLHILVAFHTKSPTLAWFDAIHIAVFSVSGFCAHYFDSRLRIKTFLTGLQRDTLTRRLRLAHRDLKRRAEHDGLTGLLTRNALVRRLKPVLAGERAFFLGIMDIDDFRGINDTFGHSAGDVVLRRMGAVLQEQFGDADMASRIGGDEFVFVLFRFPSVLPRFPTTGPRSRSCTRRRARRCIMPNGRGNGSALFTGNCLSLAPRLEWNDCLIYCLCRGRLPFDRRHSFLYTEGSRESGGGGAANPARFERKQR